MHRVEIPILQDEDIKPIPGFPTMPNIVVRWFNDKEYQEYMNPTVLDSGFNQTLIEQYKKAAMYG